MNIKFLFAAAALCAATSAPALAQTGKEDGDKTKTTADGMTTKTKMANDGKMKVKGKDDAGNRMKATTKPRRGEMADGMKHHGMKHKDMQRDSTMGGSPR